MKVEGLSEENGFLLTKTGLLKCFYLSDDGVSLDYGCLYQYHVVPSLYLLHGYLVEVHKLFQLGDVDCYFYDGHLLRNVGLRLAHMHLLLFQLALSPELDLLLIFPAHLSRYLFLLKAVYPYLHWFLAYLSNS